ncbi:MAG: hypothetical protein GF419_01850, partial [Ignavibacteriales bacterium]|nr:hypothetical protein [Ignavibacteriales bacterium]
TYAPEFNDAGEVVSLVHVSKDITERAKMESELREANAAKDKLFSVIAHDVRDPLHTIINVLNVVNHAPEALSDAKRAEYLREAERTTRGLNEMVENLLYWSRAQTEHITPELRRLDATKFFQAELARQQTKAERNGLRLNLSASDPVYVKADPQLLRIVARNLIGNAMKFTPSGGAVSVAIKPRGEFARVEVADTGVGVPPHIIDALFRIDGQAKRVGVRGEQSGGMGLVLCREFVELMGGTIDVESAHGKGSTFSFTLRAAE